MKAFARSVGLVLLGSALGVAASPDQWKGLVVGEATPDQARAVLGTPKKESLERLYGGFLTPLLSEEIKSKIFTRLHFETTGGFSRIDLFFKGSKLVTMVLFPERDNKIKARDLSSIYDGADFALLGRPEDLYQWNGVAKRVQRQYPPTYDLVAVTEKTFLMADVMQGTGESILSGVSGADEYLPGRVVYLQYFSRTLEKAKAKNQTLQ